MSVRFGGGVTETWTGNSPRRWVPTQRFPHEVFSLLVERICSVASTADKMKPLDSKAKQERDLAA